MSVPQVDAEELARALSPAAAVTALRQVLLDGYDPATDTPRQGVPMSNGEMLVMPSHNSTAAGIKVLTMAPADPERTLPRIQGQYLLFDVDTLAPRMILDGAALTSLRTPAVSVAGIKNLITDSRDPLQVVILGAGPQGRAHEATLRDVVRGTRDMSISFVSRTPTDDVERWFAAGSEEAGQLLARADLVLCATTAATPLLDLQDVRADAVIVAVGSHSPDARELTSELMGAAQVVVEDIRTALAECGDVVMAVADGSLDAASLIPVGELVRGERTVDRSRPVVFKTSGMPWEDLVLAHAIAQNIESA